MRILLLTFFVCFSVMTNAQDVYSYMSERKFFDPTDLEGYHFRPAKKETPGDYEAKKIQPGEYSFGIAKSRLYVKGDESIDGMYEVNNINTENYGYKLLLLDPRNPSVRGHLKVVINPNGEAEALVFKNKNKAKEIIFHIPKASSDFKKQERSYFTDLKEVKVDDVDDLWGMKIRPYMRSHLFSSSQDRLYEKDSTTISFEEVITLKEKKKKKKRKKKKKNQEEEQVDKSATTDSENVKTIKEYFVKIRSIIKLEDGSTEDKTWTYPIKEIIEREDETASKNEERYQVAIKVGKKEEIYLYLNGDRTISSFETEDVLYMMRGH